MGFFDKNVKSKTGGFSDVIRCDEKDYLVWKWHPNAGEEGELKRETAIRTGSTLRVKSGEVAVFVYKQADGEIEDYIVGPHDETIKTKNFPVLSTIIGLWYEGDTPFQAEVFFINIGGATQIKFGIPYFDVIDPRFPDFMVPVSVRGTLTFQVEDYKAFVKCHQLRTFSLDNLKTKITDLVTRYVKAAVTNAPSEGNIPVVAIETKIDYINQKVEANINQQISEQFCVRVDRFDISAIEIDKESEGYKELKHITKEMTTRQAEANILNYEEQLRIQRQEGQYAQHMATQQTNIGAYEAGIRGQVGVAGAEALGKMGENGVGNISLDGGQGGGGAGFNPMTIMAGMAVGTAVGQNIAGTLNNSMTGVQPPAQQTPPPIAPAAPVAPPPIPSVSFFVAQDGQQTGPFDLNTLKIMMTSGKLTPDTLVWKQGMPEWQRAGNQGELSGLFPPPIPG